MFMQTRTWLCITQIHRKVALHLLLEPVVYYLLARLRVWPSSCAFGLLKIRLGVIYTAPSVWSFKT